MKLILLKFHLSGSTGSRQSPPAAAAAEVSTPSAADHSLPSSDELSTPNTTLDAEFGEFSSTPITKRSRGK